MILSFASPFLKSLLDTPSTFTPVIVLPDVSAEAMSLLINIIYTGECQVPNKYLRQELFELCSMLQLKGVDGFIEDLAVSAALDDDDDAMDDYGIEPGEVDEHATEELHTFDEGDNAETHEEETETEQCDTEMIFVNEVDEEDDDLPQRVGSTMSFTMGTINRTPTTPTKTSPAMRNLFQPTRSARIRLVKTEAGLDIESMTQSPKPKLELDPDQIDSLKERLTQVIKKTYQHLGTRGHEKLMAMDHKERLVLRGNVLLKGNFNCVLCEKDIAVVYTTDKTGTKFKQWINSNMKRHMRRIHKDLHPSDTPEIKVITQLGMNGLETIQ